LGPFLLDANVLIALAWPVHEFHDRVGRWFARHSRAGWATCPFTEAAFVRVISNPAFSANALTVANALLVLESNVNLPHHQFWPDSIPVAGALRNVERFTGHRQITDAYLVGLALHRRGKLATFDKGIRALGIEEGGVEVIE
jgi:toxin-antitoxin system PIN domain toxin